MSKTYYIEDPNGTIMSENGQRRFKKLEGTKAFEFLNTPEGKACRFMKVCDYEETDDEVFIEVPSENMKDFRKYERREQYIADTIRDNEYMILKLEQLRTKGYIAPEVHQSQVRELQKKLSELKSERQDQFESRILTMLMDVKKLQTLIEEIEEPLETFDEKLFAEIIVGMEINKHDELTMTVLGGLKFTELI